MGAFDIPPEELKNSKIKYLDITNKLNDYNEIYNLNQHLIDSNDLEIIKLKKYNDTIVTKLMKMKQDYMLTDYSINEYELYSKILSFTIICVCILLFFIAKLNDKATLIKIAGIVGIVYLIILMFILSSNQNRRKYAWSQWYWKPAEKKK